jgi:hypothetical protein
MTRSLAHFEALDQACRLSPLSRSAGKNKNLNICSFLTQKVPKI